jgi:hypothetical protein
LRGEHSGEEGRGEGEAGVGVGDRVEDGIDVVVVVDVAFGAGVATCMED